VQPLALRRGCERRILHTCALLSLGNVDCYGENDDGEAADYPMSMPLPAPPG
jgi:hypothetical protein